MSDLEIYVLACFIGIVGFLFSIGVLVVEVMANRNRRYDREIGE